MVDMLGQATTKDEALEVLSTSFEERWRELMNSYQPEAILHRLGEDKQEILRAAQLSEDADAMDEAVALLSVANRLELEALAM